MRNKICGLQEKPSHQFFVNAGIYLIQPPMLAHIPSDRRYDMTDLVNELLLREKNVVSFPIIEYWMDIGMPEDFKKANGEYQEAFPIKNSGNS